MILVTKQERLALEKAGILQEKKKLKGGGFTDPNFVVVNKFHKGRTKHTYVIELPEVLAFLGRYDNMNLQQITPEQLQVLKDASLVEESDIQTWGSYQPEATIFIDKVGDIRMKKVTAYMKRLGFWK